MNIVSRLLRRLNARPSSESRVASDGPPPSPTTSLPDYEARIAQETTRFADEVDVNALPGNLPLLVQCLSAADPGIVRLFASRRLLRQAASSRPRGNSSGTCAARGQHRLRQLRCGSPHRRVREVVNRPCQFRDRMPRPHADRCWNAAGNWRAAAGLGSAVRRFTRADFNRWRPNRTYDVVMANQSLHHVLESRALCSTRSATAIGNDGVFVTSDMIGRNGHQRWPEALAILQEFWRELPESYRYNLQLRRQEARVHELGLLGRRISRAYARRTSCRCSSSDSDSAVLSSPSATW
jgi:hypothetical protein